jgi:hypothetical protein
LVPRVHGAATIFSRLLTRSSETELSFGSGAHNALQNKDPFLTTGTPLSTSDQPNDGEFRATRIWLEPPVLAPLLVHPNRR